MIRVKHFLDPIEPDDGHRLWVESIGLTRDFQELCDVHHVLSHLGPSMRLWLWFDQHPDGYEYFRGKYHEQLQAGPYHDALAELAAAAMKEDFTLLHQGDDPLHNGASALAEFISELQAYIKPDAPK